MQSRVRTRHPREYLSWLYLLVFIPLKRLQKSRTNIKTKSPEGLWRLILTALDDVRDDSYGHGDQLEPYEHSSPVKTVCCKNAQVQDAGNQQADDDSDVISHNSSS